MKNELKKLTARAGWLEVETIRAFTGGIGNHSFAPGSEGFARRNPNQTNFIQIIAPITTSPEQICGWFVEDYHAEKLIRIIGKTEVDANEIWRNIWNNFTNLKVYDLKTLSMDFFKK